MFAAILSVVLFLAWKGQHVDESAVPVLAREIARLESIDRGSNRIRIVSLEHRPGFKGRNVRVTYTDTSHDENENWQAERYFLISKPLLGGWYVSREIEADEYDDYGGQAVTVF